MFKPQIVPAAKYGRVYEIENGGFVPSVNTIINYALPTPEYLKKWQIEQSGGDYEKHLNNSI